MYYLFRTLYDIASIYWGGLVEVWDVLGWFGVFWGVSIVRTTVMLTVK